MVFPGELVQRNMVLANIHGNDDAYVCHVWPTPPSCNTRRRVTRRRKLLNEHFSRTAAVKCQDIQTDEARALVASLLREPTEYIKCIKRWARINMPCLWELTKQRSGAQSLVLRLTYSKAITTPAAEVWAHAQHTFVRPEPTITPFLNIWPWLKHWPAWLPGGGFRKLAQDYYRADSSMWTSLFDDVKADIVCSEPAHPGSQAPSIAQKRGTNDSSLLSRMLETNAGERYGLSELELAYVAGNLLSAGGDVRSSNGLLSEIMFVVRTAARGHYQDLPLRHAPLPRRPRPLPRRARPRRRPRSAADL
jgi:hypothetical protein